MRLAGAAVAAVALSFTVGVVADEAAAQATARLTGQIESNGGADIMRSATGTSETLTWGSRYNANLDGYIWNPRFMLYSLGGTFADQSTWRDDGEAKFSQFDPYRLRLTFFPEATHTFGLRAARSVTDNTFSGEGTDFMTTSRSENQGVSWTFRGLGRLPETSVDFNRQTIDTEGPNLHTQETRTALAIRLRKSLERSTPTGTYVIEKVDRGGDVSANGTDSGLTHHVTFEDRIRFGERTFLSPSLDMRASDQTRTLNAGATLAGPLNTSTDGSTTARYSLLDTEDHRVQTIATEASVTKRLTRDLTITTGASGGAVLTADDLTWTAGLFTGLIAAPWPHLRNTADYSLLLAGGGDHLGTTHRGHVGASSTFFPKHTLSADYFVNVFDRGDGSALFTSHNVTGGVTSLVIPKTTLTGTVAADAQEGDGRQGGGAVRVGAAVTPFPVVTVRGLTEYTTRHTSGAGRTPTSETGYAAEGGVDATPIYWMTLSLNARYGVRDLDREDKQGKFDSDAVRGSVALTFATLQVRTEGFLEHESAVDQERQGLRLNVLYRFRIWTITLEAEHAALTTAGVDTTRDRFSFRISRPLDYSYAWRP